MRVNFLAHCQACSEWEVLVSLSLLLIIIILRSLMKMEKMNLQADRPQGHSVPVI